MPLYDFKCEQHGKFEAFRRIQGATTAPCPSCGQDAEREFARTEFTHSRPYDQSVDGLYPTRGKPDILDRAGGGKAVKVKATGGYRLAVTHNTKCPKCNRMRNVALVSKMVGAMLVICEACDYSWMHRAIDAPTPLLKGTVESYRPGKTVHMNADIPLHSGYEAPERF